jgi:hypothetical protein
VPIAASQQVRLRGSAHKPAGRPLSEALSRFLFGPEPQDDPIADEERVLAMLRGQEGALAPADVMRLTGLDRGRAEALLCRAIARHGGGVEVVGAAVVYRLKPRPWGSRPTLPPVWERPLDSPAVTGNSPRTDLALALVNLVVLAASAAALVQLMASGGWWGIALVPLGLSLMTFALPIARLFARRAEQRRIAREAGRRRLLRAVIERPAGGALQAYWLSHVWIEAAGHPISPSQLAAEMYAMGGEPDVDAEARLMFRFPDLDHEGRALAAERRALRARAGSPLAAAAHH